MRQWNLLNWNDCFVTIRSLTSQRRILTQQQIQQLEIVNDLQQSLMVYLPVAGKSKHWVAAIGEIITLILIELLPFEWEFICNCQSMKERCSVLAPSTGFPPHQHIRTIFNETISSHLINACVINDTLWHCRLHGYFDSMFDKHLLRPRQSCDVKRVNNQQIRVEVKTMLGKNVISLSFFKENELCVACESTYGVCWCVFEWRGKAGRSNEIIYRVFVKLEAAKSTS